MSTVETNFLTAMRDVGLEFPGPVIADGRLHRFHVQGDRKGSRNGWYVLYHEEVPVGVFGSWKLGRSHKWHHESFSRLDSGARQRYQDRIAQAQQEAERERQTLQQKAAIRAQGIWDKASPAPPDHPYLVTKRISPHGIRVYKNLLLIPASDESGCLATLQFIS